MALRIRRKAFCLPHLSRPRTNFGRHRRWVQAQVSLCQVTPDKVARRQRARNPRRHRGCAFGVGLGKKDFVQFVCIGISRSFPELGHKIVKSKEASGTARSSSGGDDQADMERAICAPLVWDLALQQHGAVHLHALESLLRGPALGFLSTTGRAGATCGGGACGKGKGTWSAPGSG